MSGMSLPHKIIGTARPHSPSARAAASAAPAGGKRVRPVRDAHSIDIDLGGAGHGRGRSFRRSIIVAVIGDGAMSAMAYEAMNNAGAMDAG